MGQTPEPITVDMGADADGFDGIDTETIDTKLDEIVTEYTWIDDIEVEHHHSEYPGTSDCDYNGHFTVHVNDLFSTSVDEDNEIRIASRPIRHMFTEIRHEKINQ